ncbi:MAG: tetratricopeptide repeat protein [Bacteroidia bacterium]
MPKSPAMKKGYTLLSLLILLLSISQSLEAQSAKKIIKEAKSLFEQQNYSASIEKLNSVITQEPSNDDALWLRARCYKALGDCPRAISDFQAAAGNQPKNATLYEGLAQCQIQLGQTDNALISVDRMLALSPKNLSYYHLKAEILQKRRDFEQIVKVADDALRIDDEDHRSHEFAGLAADSLGNLTLAETRLKSAIDLALKSKNSRENGSVLHPYYFNLGSVQMRLFKNQEAHATLNEALKWNPADVSTLNLRGQVNLALKNYQDAITDFTAAIANDGKNAVSYYNRGLVNAQLGQFASAINDYNQAIRYNPDNYNYFKGRAESYMATTDYTSAVNDYKKAISLAPDNKDLNKAYAEARQKRYDANRESNKPSVLIARPELKNNTIEIPRNKTNLDLILQITDASPIKSVVVNGISQKIEEEAMNPGIEMSIDVKDKEQLSIQVTDVYLNSTELSYPIIKTETDPPVVNITRPYQTLENELFIENIPSIMIEGKVNDESLIKSIIIDGTSASFPLDMKNPPFQALVNIGTKDTLEVAVTDMLGNESKTTYKLLREDTSGNNPMGLTWVVFIENSNYRNLQRLEGPARDVADMKEALANYKVDKVIHKKDASKAELDKFFAIDLRDLVQKNRVKSLIVWYAGHGKFLNETGYWIPVDGDNYDEYTYYSVNNLRAAMQAYTMVKHVLVISDACESGPAFYMAMRDELSARLCDDWEVTKFKSAQVLTSSNKELSSDNSLFTQAFANTLNNNPNDCISIEAVTLKVMGIVKQNQKQTPKFGKIKGLDDENGTFFFIKKGF